MGMNKNSVNYILNIIREMAGIVPLERKQKQI